jgi:hypothetical protein
MKTAAESTSKPSLPTLEAALQWEGVPIDGLGNKTLGRSPGSTWTPMTAGRAGR